MKKLEEAVIARLREKGHIFEIFVDLEEALKVKEGKGKIEDALVIEEIYKDANKGERVSQKLLEEVFGTSDIKKIAETIIKKGEIQITTEYRRKLIEQKKKQIIEEIRRIAIDPKLNIPFTPQRIEEMLNSVRFSVDPFKPVSTQVSEAIKAIKKKYPIRVETVLLKVEIPYDAIKTLNIIKRAYKVSKEDWGERGWIGIFEVPIGILDRFYSDINRLTKNTAIIEELRRY